MLLVVLAHHIAGRDALLPQLQRQLAVGELVFLLVAVAVVLQLVAVAQHAGAEALRHALAHQRLAGGEQRQHRVVPPGDLHDLGEHLRIVAVVHGDGDHHFIVRRAQRAVKDGQVVVAFQRLGNQAVAAGLRRSRLGIRDGLHLPSLRRFHALLGKLRLRGLQIRAQHQRLGGRAPGVHEVRRVVPDRQAARCVRLSAAVDQDHHQRRRNQHQQHDQRRQHAVSAPPAHRSLFTTGHIFKLLTE